jgi:broad specificity phosphatase PhoE
MMTGPQLQRVNGILLVAVGVIVNVALPGEVEAKGLPGWVTRVARLQTRAGGAAGSRRLDPSELKNTYYILRHGQSRGNEKGVISCGLPALIRHGLTAKGRAQATRAGELSTSTMPKDTIIISSPLKRARQTARLFRRASGIRSRVKYHWALRERGFGKLNLAHYKDYQRLRAADEIRHKQGAIGPNEEPSLERRGVESVASVQGRMAGLVTELERKYQGRTILLVGHDNTQKALFTLLPAAQAQSLSHRALKIPNGQVFRLGEETLGQVLRRSR